MIRHFHRKGFVGIILLSFLISSFSFTGHTSYLKKRGIPYKGKPAKDSMHLPNPADTLSKSPHPELSYNVYKLALVGYEKLSNAQKHVKPILTIVDFSKPSSEKRLFIIDMPSQKVILHTWVAHGLNSGEKIATRFSNTDASHQSSLGFYITGNTYNGSNGYSLKLKGLEAGFNDKAESRAIVMHGAPYVSEQVVKNIGRLGRSWGCPAVSQLEHKKIIDLIKGGSCLFMYATQPEYLASSKLLQDSVPLGGSL